MRNIFKTHKIFIVLFIIAALFLSMGCGGGGGGSSNNNNNGGDNRPYCIVSFDTNGGSSVESQQVEPGGTVDMPDAPERENYIFVGWYTDNDSFNNMFLFGDNGDAVNSDITLYAQWVEYNPDLALARYALSEINIIYQDGDNADHVTGNLTLPDRVEALSADSVNITWESSNPSVVSITGNVVRPQGSDSNVTLTVRAAKGNESDTKTFSLKVMHAHDRDISSIINHSMVALQNLSSNDANGLYVTYNNDKSKVSTIDGRFSEFNIENADDASDAVYGLRSILGLANPKEELKPSVVAKNDHGSSYSFQQYYKDVKVYGRGVSAYANASGVGRTVNSSILPTARLDSADAADNSISQAVITASQAQEKALSYHGSASTFTVTQEPEFVIYTLDEYEDNPISAYIVGVHGTADNNYYNEMIFINAADGNVFKVDSIIRGEDRIVSARGLDEVSNDVSFDVTLSFIRGNQDINFYMRNNNPNIEMYTQSNGMYMRVANASNEWKDGQQISAYVNMQRILNWWKSKFNRNALDGNGTKLNVFVHDRYMRDNAYWDGRGIYFCDIGDTSEYAHSYAPVTDVSTHESTHAVMQYCVPNLARRYAKAPGAINEGYADVFGCLLDRDWKIGRSNNITNFKNYDCLRDIANPESSSAASHGPVKLGNTYEIYRSTDPNDMADNYGVHSYSFLVSHAAYLMWSYMSEDWDTLGRLWYAAIFQDCGLNKSDANFHTLRAALLRAADAEHLNLSSSWRAAIRRAFDEEEIYAPQGGIEGTITDVDGNPVANAAVIAYRDAELISSVTTGSDGKYALSLDVEFEVHTYKIQVIATNYTTFNGEQKLDADINTTLNISLVAGGTGTVTGTITNAVTAGVMSGVNIEVLSGWNSRTGSPVSTAVTDTSGKYSFSLEAGYYTLVLNMSGYAASYINIISVGGQTRTYNSSLSNSMASNEYRIILRWAENPRDLDSHLVCRTPDGEEQYHVYFLDKEGYSDTDHTNLAASLDVDDTDGEGPETVTFILDNENTYTYFVHWYAGSGTWSASNANIEVFEGVNRIAVHTVPTANTNYDGSQESWIVFKILPGGIFQTVDTISTEQTDKGIGVARTLKMPAKEKGDRNNN